MADDTLVIDILRRSSRRSIRLHITDDGKIEVRAPKLVPLFMLRRFVTSHRDWIERTRKRMSAMPKTVKRTYAEGEIVRIAGTDYRIHITEGNAIVLAGSRLFFPKKYAKHPKPHMEVFLRKFALKHLTERMAHFSRIMGVSYKRISIRDTSSRWGSCSSTGTISFAYRLVLADAPIIDYVVIHELAHVTHNHHQQSFWNRVGDFCPEYRLFRAWLRKNGHTLRI